MTAYIHESGLDGITVWRKDLATSDITAVDGIPTTTINRTKRDCHEASDRPVALKSLGEAVPISDDGPMERARAHLIDGKVVLRRPIARRMGLTSRRPVRCQPHCPLRLRCARR